MPYTTMGRLSDTCFRSICRQLILDQPPAASTTAAIYSLRWNFKKTKVHYELLTIDGLQQ